MTDEFKKLLAIIERESSLRQDLHPVSKSLTYADMQAFMKKLKGPPPVTSMEGQEIVVVAQRDGYKLVTTADQAPRIIEDIRYTDMAPEVRRRTVEMEIELRAIERSIKFRSMGGS